MDWWMLALGVVCLGVVGVDFLFTTIAASGVGWLTKAAAAGAFVLIKKVSSDRPSHLVHRVAGPASMVAVAGLWITLTALGWLLVFASYGPAVTSDGEQASLFERLIFVTSSLSTVGSANPVPGGAFWDWMSTIAAVTGMIVLTLSVSFVLNVVQTVATGRALATLVHSIDPADPANASTFAQVLTENTSQLRIAPIALYYTSRQPERRVADAFLHLVWKLSDDRRNFRTYLPSLTRLSEAGIEPDDGYEATALKLERWADDLKLGTPEADPEPRDTPVPAFARA